MRYQFWIQSFVILVIVIFFLYKIQSCHWSLSSFLKSNDCIKSLRESDDFICESEELWYERKELYRIQDELNMKKLPSSPFFLKNWEPNFHCSHARRIGVMGDGGKWVCDLFRLRARSNCLLYSAGSKNDFSFEIEMKNNLPNCEIHTFDVNLYECPKNVCVFHQLRLGNGKSLNTSKTWQMIIKQLEHQNRVIDILKIDIEGGEFEFFPTIFQFSDKFYPQQILVEVHPKQTMETHYFFELLRKNNYVIFNKEPNLLVRGTLFEYAFLKLNPRFFE
jgi:hypothetical protein